MHDTAAAVQYIIIDKAFQHLEIELRKIRETAVYVVSGVGGIEAIISADVRYMQIKCEKVPPPHS